MFAYFFRRGQEYEDMLLRKSAHRDGRKHGSSPTTVAKMPELPSELSQLLLPADMRFKPGTVCLARYESSLPTWISQSKGDPSSDRPTHKSLRY